MARKPKAGGIKLLVVVSDLHCGDTAAIAPPGFMWGDDGNKLDLNVFQSWLWGCWTEFGAWVQDTVGSEPYALLINGDVTEGVHHGGKGIWSPYHADHLNAAAECLAPLAHSAQAIYIVDGTECHTRQGETGLGYMLDAKRDHLTGRFSARKWKIDICGKRIHATHHVSTSAREYLKASKLSIALGDEILRYQKHRNPPDIILRAHCHTAGEYREPTRMAITTPPWKGIDRHTSKVVPGADRDTVDVGGVILDWREVEPGDLPMTRWKIYSPPAPKVESI